MPVCVRHTEISVLIPIFDETNDRYVLMQTGWDRGRRVRGSLIYIALHKGKISIEYDGIEHGITDDLIRIGIPEDQIVLSYMPDMKRGDGFMK